MIINNEHKLPDSWVGAVESAYDVNLRDLKYISATALELPPRIRIYTARYWDRIEVDAASEAHSLFGEAMHYVIEKATKGKERYISNERISMPILDKILTGRPDIYDRETKLIEDYKTTSAWSYVFSLSKWENQLNIYSYLVKNALHLEVSGLLAVVYFKDWNKDDSAKSSSYPERPVLAFSVRMWPDSQTIQYIEDRIKVHSMWENTPDEDIPVCTPEERWAKPESWGIYKGKKRDRAISRVYTEREAKERLAELRNNNPRNEYEIEHKPGADTRCDRYCDVNKFCNYYGRKTC